ncbi:hypothetical protein HN371_11440 [Candidatus Poribacteria bacterium]|jgi:hypothetical protein|nr:hypothetical protein [Candidatus Poribacteria bacterium]MBT5532599.1 hypothetical protein [Candidatus Poribacteria bacterium]MBT5713691.1 hypothetical protein [Candidatus Poribacteria bacterium]MBT7097220.1 hypothetical protein [Candidatus Poribacteria bacterium]MBT7807441.1 hypothetical protein [Candidatus Poribacteria bacterium]
MHRLRIAPVVATLAIALTAAAAPTLTTDEKRYDVGEWVVFTFDNDSAEVIGWGSFGRHPVVYREFASGKREAVYTLPDAMDRGAVMLPPGERSQWVWNQHLRAEEDGEDDDGDDPDQGIAVGEPNPNADEPREPAPMVGNGDRVRAGSYVAEFETFDRTYMTPPFIILGTLSVDPVGKAAVTWGSLKARR